MSRGIECAAWVTAARDGEMKRSKAGNDYGVVVLRADSGLTDEAGQSTSVFLRCMAFGPFALAAANMKKGSKAYVEGSLSIGIWQPPEGGPAKLDLTLKAFKLEATKIGKDRPPTPGQRLGERFNAERPQHEAPTFDDAIPF